MIDSKSIIERKKISLSENEQIEILLDIICQRLQIGKTKEEKLQAAYRNITSCIEKDDFFDLHDAVMYAFGSRAINTVVKPKGRDEYDLDFTVQIILSNLNISPKELVDKLFSCLVKNGNFEGKIKLIRYGVRVIYSGDFHVDIMIGVSSIHNRLLVPDWKENKWVNRNPKGYIKWFENRYISDFANIQLFNYYKENFPKMFDKTIEIESRTETEEITPAVTYPEIQPIQRITQLFKRHRDIFFLKNMPDYKCSSIILTTLIGDSYLGENSIYSGMTNVIQRNMDLIGNHNDFPFKLINPADRGLSIELQENLTDKWEKDLKYYRAFRQYIRKIAYDWNKLNSLNSIRAKADFLQSIFGENIVKAAYEALNENLRNLGQPHDNLPLPFLISPIVKNEQVALAESSRGRKPYYAK